MKKMVLAVFSVLFFVPLVWSQTGPRTVPINCGDVVETEFLEVNITLGREPDNYTVELGAGDAISVRMVPVGSNPNIFFRIFDRNRRLLFDTSWGRGPGQAEIIEDFVVPATGTYTVGVGSDIVTAYTLYIGCIVGGEVIEPGSPVQTTEATPLSIDQFSGFGFSGLPPVDFSTAFINTLTLGTEITAQIPIAGDAILGYAFDGTAGEAFTLNFGRNSGNLNLGLVVLSADNEVAFQASLVNSNLLVTNFTLPSTGQYTIGIFRIDLVPVENPQPTQFRLNGTIG